LSTQSTDDGVPSEGTENRGIEQYEHKEQYQQLDQDFKMSPLLIIHVKLVGYSQAPEQLQRSLRPMSFLTIEKDRKSRNWTICTQGAISTNGLELLKGQRFTELNNMNTKNHINKWTVTIERTADRGMEQYEQRKATDNHGRRSGKVLITYHFSDDVVMKNAKNFKVCYGSKNDLW
jgi:hypothetical protein